MTFFFADHANAVNQLDEREKMIGQKNDEFVMKPSTWNSLQI